MATTRAGQSFTTSQKNGLFGRKKLRDASWAKKIEKQSSSVASWKDWKDINKAFAYVTQLKLEE